MKKIISLFLMLAVIVVIFVTNICAAKIIDGSTEEILNQAEQSAQIQNPATGDIQFVFLVCISALSIVALFLIMRKTYLK